jgi:hypothetical protein
MYAKPFNVVIGIVKAVDFQFATVAGTGIDMADCQRVSDVSQNLFVDLPDFIAQSIIRLRRGFALVAGAEDLFDDL